MNDAERRAFEFGCESVLAELFNAIAELEESRGATSYGKGQRYILKQLVHKMMDKE